MPEPLLTTMQLGQLLQSARKARKLTQAEVGARLGLSQKRISAIELDPGRLTAEQLLRLCAVVGLELGIDVRRKPQPAPVKGAMGAKGAKAAKAEW